MEPAIFLDRDGTLVPDNEHTGNPAKIALVEGIAPSLRRLRDAGFRLVVATNQGGVARGRFTEADVDAYHRRLSDLLDAATGLRATVERFYYCPFHPEGTVAEYTRDHPWRKPKPGMIVQAAQDMELELERSWGIGDTPRDIAACRAAGLRTVIVSRNREHIADAGADFSAETMGEAVELVLRHRDELRGTLTPRTVANTSTRGKQRPPLERNPREHRHVAAVDQSSEQERESEHESEHDVSRSDVSRSDVPRNDDPTRSAKRSAQSDRDEQPLRRALHELTEEVRALRMHRSETHTVRIAAMGLQLVTILVAAVAFLNLSDFQSFVRWGIAATMLQLITGTILLFDRQ